jgi:hypothetical protein
MALAALANATVTITDGSVSFDVGALSMADLAELRRQHVVRLFDMIEHYGALLQDPSGLKRSYGIASVFLEMSDAVAHAIALAAREPDRIAEASRLPVGTQIYALSSIIQLSLEACPSAALPTSLKDLVETFNSLRPEQVN